MPHLLRCRWHVLFTVCAALAIGLAAALLPLDQIAALIIAAVTATLVAIIFTEPLLGMAFTLVTASLGPLENITLGLPIESGQALLLLTLAAWVARMLYRRKLNAGAGPIMWPLLIFITVAALSFFAARSFELWAKELLKWVEVFAVYVCVASEVRSSPRASKILIAAILLSTLFQAALGIYQFGLRGQGPHEFAILGGRYFRAYGTFEQPNPFGGYMGLSWPFAAGVALWAWRRLRRSADETKGRGDGHPPSHSAPVLLFAAISATFVSGLAFVALVLSWSRGAWLGAGAAAAAMIVTALRKPLLALGVAITVVPAIASFDLTSLLPAPVRERFTGFTQEFSSFDVRGVKVNAQNYSVIERLSKWQAAQNMILDRPYLGVGFGNYGAAYDQYRTLNWPVALGHAHNYYLNVFAETGVAGLLAYLGLWSAILVRTIRWARRRCRAGSANIDPLGPYLGLGLLGAWVQLSVHNVVDNLYVANIFLLVGVYFGILDGAARE